MLILHLCYRLALAPSLSLVCLRSFFYIFSFYLKKKIKKEEKEKEKRKRKTTKQIQCGERGHGYAKCLNNIRVDIAVGNVIKLWLDIFGFI